MYTCGIDEILFLPERAMRKIRRGSLQSSLMKRLVYAFKTHSIHKVNRGTRSIRRKCQVQCAAHGNDASSSFFVQAEQ